MYANSSNVIGNEDFFNYVFPRNILVGIDADGVVAVLVNASELEGAVVGFL